MTQEFKNERDNLLRVQYIECETFTNYSKGNLIIPFMLFTVINIHLYF